MLSFDTDNDGIFITTIRLHLGFDFACVCACRNGGATKPVACARLLQCAYAF